MSSFALENYLQMDANVATLATSLCVSLFVIACCVRYVVRHCCTIRSKQASANYTAQYYITNSAHQYSRFYFDERNQIRSMVITASIQPTPEQYPQIVGFVLEPSVLDQERPESPCPPRYEDALKPGTAPPQYEEQSTSSNSPIQSIDLPPSGRTTARIESSLDETSDGNVEELKSPRESRCRRQRKKSCA